MGSSGDDFFTRGNKFDSTFWLWKDEMRKSSTTLQSVRDRQLSSILAEPDERNKNKKKLSKLENHCIVDSSGGNQSALSHGQKSDLVWKWQKCPCPNQQE